MKVAAGSVLDRPWGQTLGTVGMRKINAQVNVRTDDGKTYSVAFSDGLVVGAVSPLPNDSVTRVALTSHFVSPSQVNEITRRLAVDKARDEVEIVAEAGKLSLDHVATLRRRLTIQRAARTFAIDRATFDIEGAITLPTHPGFGVSLGSVIYQGARMNLSDQRLAEDLRELGSSFRMRATATDDDLAALEVDGDIRGIVTALRAGTTLAELDATHREIEPRTLHAFIYALVCTGLCDATGGQAVDRTAPPAPRTSTGLVTPRASQTIRTDTPLITRAKTTNAPPNMSTPESSRTVTQPGAFSTRSSDIPTRNVTPRATTTSPPVTRTPTSPPATRTPTSPPLTARAPTPPLDVTRGRTPTSPPTPLRTGARATSTPFDDFRREATTADFKAEISTSKGTIVEEFNRDSTTSRRLNALMPRTITTPRTITERERAGRDIETLIATRLAKLEQGADYFAMLGVPFEAPIETVRAAYVDTTRKLHPDSLAQVGIVDDATKHAQRVLAQVNAAFAVLSDPQKRREYVSAVRRGEATPVAPRARTGDLDKAELAAEAFAKGESALKRDDMALAVEELGRAHALVPTNLDYMTMSTWANFCAAPDKSRVYAETRKALQHVIHRVENPVPARFILGRVERMVGHDREAIGHFELVLMEEPGHKEAQSEMRVLQSRLAKGTKPKR